MATIRQRLFVELEPTVWTRQGLSLTNKLVSLLILLSAFTAIIETEPTVYRGREALFIWMEWGFTFLFGIEYLARVWVSGEDPRYGPGLKGTLRYIRSPAALLDLLALSPILLTLAGSEAFLLRVFRLARILRLSRLGRFSMAMHHLADAMSSRRHELFLSVCVALLLLVVSATMLYLVEGGIQPKAFGSIPRAMWWSIATLTTVGYGDVYPVTALGQFLGALTAITGIGLIAMPTGILAAAFSDAMQRNRDREGDEERE